jgi:hypothetical protein
VGLYRNGKVWTQEGTKLVGNGAVGHAQQGSSIALSADGNTAVMGGPNDNSFVGAAWVFVQPTVLFNSFSATFRISKSEFLLNSVFTLGNASNGIDPLYEAVTFQVGGLPSGLLTKAIPPFSFIFTGPGDYSFTSVTDAVTMNVLIKLTSGKTYTFQAAATTNLTEIKSPAKVTLTIGNNTGTTVADF